MRKATSLLILTMLAFGFDLGTADCFGQSAATPMPMRPGRGSFDPKQMYLAPSTKQGKSVLIPAGTTWEGRISRTISSKKSQPGERFEIVLASPVLSDGRDVIIPAGTAIIGEVVEAVPADKVYRNKWTPKVKIRGKLRVSVSGIRTPDGITYPMVAKFIGEQGRWAAYSRFGTGVAYTGSESSFEVVHPDMHNRARRSERPGHAPRATEKQVVLRDELYGMGGGREDNNNAYNTIRSLVLEKRDYWIHQGSPMTVKLTAPLKIGISAPNMGVPVQPLDDTVVDDTLPPPSTAQGNGRTGSGALPTVDAAPDVSGADPSLPDSQPPRRQQPPAQIQQSSAPSADSF